jgi:hypothetical protein
MGWDGLVAARNVLAKHKVVGSTPITRSQFVGKSRTSEDRSRPFTPGRDRSCAVWVVRRWYAARAAVVEDTSLPTSGAGPPTRSSTGSSTNTPASPRGVKRAARRHRASSPDL